MSICTTIDATINASYNCAGYSADIASFCATHLSSICTTFDAAINASYHYADYSADVASFYATLLSA